MNKPFLKQEINDIIKSQIFINEDINSLKDNHEIENKKLISNIDNLKKELENKIKFVENKLEKDSRNIEKSIYYVNTDMNEKLESMMNTNYERSNTIINSIQVKNQEQIKKIMEIQGKQSAIDRKIDDLNALFASRNNMLNERVNEMNELQKKAEQNIAVILEKISKDNKRRFWIIIGLLVFIALIV